MMNGETIEVYTDGGCRGGNPGGVAAYGFLIEGNGSIKKDYGILKEGERATNNYAEYMAPIKALEWLKDYDKKIAKIVVKSDSQLLIKQMNGEWSVNSQSLRELWGRLNDLTEHFEKQDIEVEFEHISRDDNKKADGLANLALDDYFLAQELKDEEEKKVCPECGEEMVVREGKYGKFYGCTGYPECDHTEEYDGE